MATSFCVALRRPFLEFCKNSKLIVNCLPSSLRISVDKLDKTVVPDFYSVFDQETLFTNLGFTRPLSHFTPVKCKAHWLLAFQKYTILHVVINLLILFWEIHCIEIYFRTCAGFHQTFRFEILLSCVGMRQHNTGFGEGLTQYFKIYHKNI